MTRSTPEFIPSRPEKGPSTFNSGFTQMRFCVICKRRRSYTQFKGDSNVCCRCMPLKGCNK